MILRFYNLGRNFTRSLLKSTKIGLLRINQRNILMSTKIGLPRINQRNILMLVLPMSLFLFIDFPQDLSLGPCSCEPGVSRVSDTSAYEFDRAFIVIGIDED